MRHYFFSICFSDCIDLFYVVLCILHEIPIKMVHTSFYMHGLQSYDDFCSAVEFFSHKSPMLKMGKNL